MKTAALIALKVIALTIIMIICYIFAGSIVQLDPPPPEQAGSAGMALVVMCFLNTLVLTYVILRSRWTGVRLMAVIFFVFYGVTTIMSQMETAVFVTLPPGVLPRLFLMGGLVAAPFAVLAVLVLGKGRSAAYTGSNERLIMPASEWLWKLAVIAIAYVILYFTFGYFIAWSDPAVREYYSGTDEGGFISNMAATVRNMPWLVPFQIFRAMLWTALALPVVRMMRGKRSETALAIGLLFAVVMNTQLLLPNPYMPEAVRITHLIETASSNFIFGMLVGTLLMRR